MKKFWIVCLFATSLSAQVTKGTLTQDFLLPSNTFAAVPFDSSDFDIPAYITPLPGPGIGIPPGTVSMRDGARFVAIYPGIYFFFGQIYFDQSCAGSVRTFAILKNGEGKQVVGSVGLPGKAVSCAEGITLQVSGMVFLNAREFVTFNVFQDTGNVLSVAARWCPTADCMSATWGTGIKVW